MKNILFCLIVTCIFSSCQKSVKPQEEFYENSSLKEAKEFLKTQVSQYEFGMLDWKRAAVYMKGNKTEIISVPLKNALPQKSAYVFFYDNRISGNWVSLEIGNGDLKYKKIVSEAFNLNRVGIVAINENGSTKAIEIYENGILINNILSRTSALIYVPASVAGPNLTVLLLAQYLGVGQPDWNSSLLVDENQFEYLEPDSQGEGGGYEIYLDILFDYIDKPAIDLQKFFNCFNNVPDNGANYTIKLCTDLPVDGSPWWMESLLTPGHTFLTITKTNGSQSVTQSFGFYPISGLRSIWSSSCASKIIDDGNHEVEASIAMTITQSEFTAFKNTALSIANSQYDLDDFNCADYALYCFNSIRSTPIEVPDTFRTFVNYGTTPNGVYEKLKDMKDNNHAEAANIFIGETSSPTSQGECN